MNKLYAPLSAAFLLSLLILNPFSRANAQTPHTISEAKEKSVHPSYHQLGQRTNGIVDTIFDYFDRSTAFYELTAGTGGYTLGTNSFTEEVAVHYTSLGGPTKITDVAVFFAAKEIILTTDSLVAGLTLPTQTLCPMSRSGLEKSASLTSIPPVSLP